MGAKNAYAEWLLEWLGPLGRITSRAMMGGHVLYCNGTVFAIVAANVMYLKVNEATRARFEALGRERFQPFADKPFSMSYYQPPTEFFEDESVMLEWARGAVAAGAAEQKKKRPRKRISGA